MSLISSKWTWVELKTMKGRSRFKIPWREKEVSEISYFYGQKDSRQFQHSSLLDKELLPTRLSFYPYLWVSSLTMVPPLLHQRLPTLDPSLRPLCPDPGSPSGVSPRNMHTWLPASAPHPRSASIKMPLVFLNPVLFPYSPSHHLHPGPVSALLLSPSALSPISSLFSPRILLNLNN